MQWRSVKLYNNDERQVLNMRFVVKMLLLPVVLFAAFLALMAKFALTLSGYVLSPLMLFMFGCGIYTLYMQWWGQFVILLFAEFACFVLLVGATAIVSGMEYFSEWLMSLA